MKRKPHVWVVEARWRGSKAQWKPVFAYTSRRNCIDVRNRLAAGCRDCRIAKYVREEA